MRGFAKAYLVHKLGRSWRKSSNKPLVESYMEILNLFGDTEDLPFSIHNLLEAGSAYCLTAGSWEGPYAMCRTWESLVRSKREESDGGVMSSMMGLCVVSGDEDGERGGAPVLCIEDVSRYCSELSRGQADWVPILLMVPLVLGLEKVYPRGFTTSGQNDEKVDMGLIRFCHPNSCRRVHMRMISQIHNLKTIALLRYNPPPGRQQPQPASRRRRKKTSSAGTASDDGEGENSSICGYNMMKKRRACKLEWWAMDWMQCNSLSLN